MTTYSRVPSTECTGLWLLITISYNSRQRKRLAPPLSYGYRRRELGKWCHALLSSTARCHGVYAAAFPKGSTLTRSRQKITCLHPHLSGTGFPISCGVCPFAVSLQGHGGDRIRGGSRDRKQNPVWSNKAPTGRNHSRSFSGVCGPLPSHGSMGLSEAKRRQSLGVFGRAPPRSRPEAHTRWAALTCLRLQFRTSVCVTPPPLFHR